jgi:hypothetical protein
MVYPGVLTVIGKAMGERGADSNKMKDGGSRRLDSVTTVTL